MHEAGTNTGKEVDEYLAAADVGPGNPWCASFITWSLQKAGHKMDGTGWAAVQTWVRNAEAGKNDLKIISADQARPGDIVAYDWGKQDDFGSDGHIGFVASEVKGGKFTALEGNNQDQVMRVPRDTNMANVKFIRIGGDAPAPAAGAVPAATPDGAGVADAVSAAAGSGGGGNPYPGDNAGKAQLAAWLGREAEKRGLPKQLPVMASLVESGVKNLNYGDADSVGFFQMRVGIWNKGEYAGFPEKPELQAKWFLDQAEAVKKQRIARGQSVTDPKQFGDWIADIERPAEQYRGRYALRLGEANSLLGSAGVRAAGGRRAGRRRLPGTRGVRGGRRRRGRGRGRRWRRRRPEGAGRAQGGGEVHRHQVQVGRLDAADRLRLLRPRAVGLRQGGHPDPARHRRPVLRLERHAGRPRRPAPGRPRLLRRAGQHLPRRDLDGRGQVPARAEDRRRRQGREPEGVLLLLQLRRRAALRHQRAGRRRRCRRRARGPGRCRRRARDRSEGRRRGAGRGRARRRRGQPPGLRPLHGDQVAGGAAPPDRPVHAGDRPEGRQVRGRAPGGRRCRARRRRSRPPPHRLLRLPPADPADAAGTGSGADAGEPVQLPDDISDDYPGNNASKDEIAKWLAKQADKHGLPPELPVMASLVESGVKNLNYGDADSVGFFQMRVGIWNQGDYKGFPEHPELQAKWFIDQAVAVKKRAIASGDADFGKDPSKWGEWIADIERPAEQYRGRYQLRLREARGLLKG